MAAGAPDPAKALARRVNLLELLGDAHPEVPEPPEEARTDWTPEQIEAYYDDARGGGERPAGLTMAEEALEPDPLPASTRPDGMYTCQRIGCDAVYDPRDPAATNPPGCCRYHPGAPLFHEGNKSWTCCGQKSHDFSLFMDIAGCATGRHTQRKPPKPATANVGARDSAGVKPTKLETLNPRADLKPSSSSAPWKREDCNRCRSGFFCSDHAASAEAAGVRISDGARRGSVAATDTRNHRNHRPAPNADLPQRRLRREVHRSRKRRRRVRVSPGTAHLPRTQKRMGVLRPDTMGLRRVPEDTDVRGGETLREPGERGGVREDESEVRKSPKRRSRSRFVLQQITRVAPGRW